MQRYEAALSRYIHRLTFVDPDDAADILQDSFIHAYRHLNDYDFDFKFSSWIYRIVHNQSVNFLKKHHRHPRLVIEDGQDEIVDWLTSDTDIEKETIDLHFSDYIQTLLDRLRPEYKSVLILKFFESKDYQEISDILQKPMGTVATLISRAKIEFKKLYDQQKNH